MDNKEQKILKFLKTHIGGDIILVRNLAMKRFKLTDEEFNDYLGKYRFQRVLPKIFPKIPKIKVRTIEAKHIEQLPWIHDDKFSFENMVNLGKHNGAVILQDSHGNLHRVSITVVFQQTIECLSKILPWSDAYKVTSNKIGEMPQLFTE
jgi:hypothetical protein